MTKILVPTDFSPTAEIAFRFAVNLASKIQSEVVLYHVFTPLENPYIDTEAERDDYNKKTSGELHQQLDDLKSRLESEFSSVAISTELGRSPIIESILSYAETNNFKMIVMGTQGATGIKKVVIGSQAARVIEDTKIPVLLVPDEFTGEIPRKILFATTYDVNDKEPLSSVLEWTSPLKPTITIAHISDNENKENDATMEDYQNAVPEIFDSSHLSFKHIDATYSIETLEKLTVQHPYDMLSMIRRKKSFLGRLFFKSLSRDMAYLTKYPLLIIPEK